MIIDKKYLVLKTDPSKGETKILVLSDGELIFDFDVRFADETTEKPLVMYYDMSHLAGKDAEFRNSKTGEPFETEWCDEMPEPEQDDLRPMIHFTVPYGWINDPNGLVKDSDGTYHLFCQHNPAGTQWGNMTWGHAVSENLIDWEYLGEALVPDKSGTMYSGSAIVDEKNASGLSPDGKTILLFYTAAGENSLLSKGVPFTQNLAYSTDGGKTFVKYDRNPIIKHIIGGNRDPKVIWCEELNTYLLALYLDGNEYCLFESDNLTDWKKLQDVHMPIDAECPDFYPLTVKSTGERKWIFSGASDTYVVGHIDIKTRRFCPEQDNIRFRLGTGESYAAQTYSGTGDRRIKIAWENLNAPGQCFHSQMGIPVEMTLDKVGGCYRLAANPVSELDMIAGETEQADEITEVTHLNGASLIRIHGDKITSPYTVNVNGTDVTVDISKNEITFSSVSVPVTYTLDVSDIRIYADTCGFELFADCGRIYTSYGTIR